LTALYFPTSGTNMEMGLWNVTSCLSTGCTSPGPALDTETISGLNLPRYLSTSFRAGKPYLYVGTEFTCTRDEADWLFEITGSGNAARLSRVDTRVGYWEWYYGASNVNGTFDARPRRAKFLGDHLYRAMWSFFDVHRFRGGPSTEPPSGGTGGSGQGGEGAAGGSGGSGWSGSGGVVAASGAGGEGANAAEPQADPDVDSSCATVGSSPTGSVPWWFALGLVALVLRSRRSS
jgi:MYXO-CTERM domain-containing protein